MSFRKQKIYRWLAPVLLTASTSVPLAGGCAAGSRSLLYSNEQILTHIAYDVIAAGYSSLSATTNELKAAVDTLVANPNETNLEAARTAWQTSRRYLKQAEVIEFGPGLTGFLYEDMDGYPKGFLLCATASQTCNVDESLEEIIAGTDNLDAEDIDRMGAAIRSFAAVEYLLYRAADGATGSPAIVSGLTGRRAEFLRNVSQVLSEKAAELATSWLENGDDFAAQLARAGMDSEEFSTQLRALSVVVQQMINACENGKDRKLGAPVGLTMNSGGETNPDSAESIYSNYSIQDLKHTVQGIELLYTGDFVSHTGEQRPGPGMNEIVIFLEPATHKKISNAFTGVYSLIDRVTREGGLATAIENDSSTVSGLFNAMKELLVLLATDLTAFTGTNPGVSSNDGD